MTLRLSRMPFPGPTDISLPYSPLAGNAGTPPISGIAPNQF
jgi:hypothetical protein